MSPEVKPLPNASYIECLIKKAALEAEQKVAAVPQKNVYLRRKKDDLHYLFDRYLEATPKSHETIRNDLIFVTKLPKNAARLNFVAYLCGLLSDKFEFKECGRWERYYLEEAVLADDDTYHKEFNSFQAIIDLARYHMDQETEVGLKDAEIWLTTAERIMNAQPNPKGNFFEAICILKLKQKQYKSAAEYADKYHEHVPKSNICKILRAKANIQLKKFEEAIADLLSLPYKNRGVCLDLCRAYKGLGKIKKQAFAEQLKAKKPK